MSMSKDDEPVQGPSTFYSEPRSGDGWRDFRDLVGKRGPDPLRAGHAFRDFTGDPTAAELNTERLENRLPEVVVDKENFLPTYFLKIGHEHALAVCRIVVQRGVDHAGQFRPDGWKGTGFLVGPTLLLTNHHVINSRDVAREAVCQFNYLIKPDGKAEVHAEFQLVPEDLFLTSHYKDGLDYTFVAIVPGAAAKFGTVELERAAYTVHLGSLANIIQHPNGRPQEIVLHDNQVMSDNGTLLHYLSDTDYGSSGSPVFNNAWKLIALHHARKPNDGGLQLYKGGPAPKFLNEGVKISSIATDLEQRAEQEGPTGYAAVVLKAFTGVNSISGFFGTLGRETKKNGSTTAEIVVDLYKGTEADVDVGFWNIEWFATRFRERARDIAMIMADFNLDIWCLSESSPVAADRLVEILRGEFGLEFAVAHSEPDAGSGKQSTSVLWNTKTVAGERQEWPDDLKGWFLVDSREFEDDMLEAVHGKVFDRYPGLFRFSIPKAKKPFDFYLVPLHLKAKGEGSLRRGMATKILAAAINRMIDANKDKDWVIGGDFNAEISSEDFAPLSRKKFEPISAEDEGHGAITYLKAPHRSMIDHIYLSPNLAKRYGPRDFYIVAADRSLPDYLAKISDHRPVLARLSLGRAEKPADKQASARPAPGSTIKDEVDKFYSGSDRKLRASKRGKRGSSAAQAAQKEIRSMQSRSPARRPKTQRRKKRAASRSSRA
jgi:hypothetical protein